MSRGGAGVRGPDLSHERRTDVYRADGGAGGQNFESLKDYEEILEK